MHAASLRRRRPPLVTCFITLAVAAGVFAGLSGDPARTAVGNPDRQGPKVKITSPAAGATVTGTITVSGTASDNVSVSTVELRVDGNPYQLASGTTSWTSR